MVSEPLLKTYVSRKDRQSLLLMATTAPNLNTNSTTSTSATPNPSQSPIFLLSNICNLITTRLDSSNYVAWKFQISSILKAHSLIGYIDGTYPCPNKFVQDERGAATAQINPEYQIWNTQDQALMTLLNATLSQTALSHVIGYSTSREAWLALERRFSASTRSNILQLKSALHNISKGKDSIDSYIQKIKRARDSLASVSVLIEDEDILIYVLNGLPQEYNAFKTSIRTKSENITLEEVYAMLKIEEQTIESVHKQNNSPPFPGAMMATNYRPNFSSNRGYSPSNFSGRGRGRGRFSNRGGRMHSFGRFQSPNFGQSNLPYPTKQPQQSNQRSNNSHPVVCQICNKNGHSALDCYHRMDFSYQGKPPSPQLTAMSATYNTGSDCSPNYWYTDTGATNHITADLANLNFPVEYQGDDNITIANGQALDISHSGQSSIHANDHTFRLNNVLCVPSMATNLLSVHQFCKDNHCRFIFDSEMFQIQDKATKQLLFQGPSDHGLYPLPTSSITKHSAPSPQPPLHFQHYNKHCANHSPLQRNNYSDSPHTAYLELGERASLISSSASCRRR
ncbi:hypothetical protein F0562_030285 [Nyssa sinensis]|uniref:Retrovirus-related Pol polyprotein from transposon TNT 1-94-like beta-barrel domain-containing protein n=1 Tax=Nyssa sinensis TaxID=561372 RepID=A0A5J5B049_9ASTE|nr:hypothetical protein F0562_030285 [Nyssa sinensis]